MILVKVFPMSWYHRQKWYLKFQEYTIFPEQTGSTFSSKGIEESSFYGFMANRYRKSMLSLCKMLMGIPLSEQTEDLEELNDTAFLFWKYFGVDITLCSACSEGHIGFIKIGIVGG
jgi:hypothetical protein